MGGKMKVVLNDIEEFVDAIKVVNTLIAETTIKIDTEKLSIISLDPANVSMIVVEMKKEAFSEWDVDKEYSLGVKVSELKSVLARGTDKKGSIELVVEENKLKVLLKSTKGKSKEFKLALIELENKVLKMPELKFDVEIMLDNADLKDAIEDAKIASDSLTLQADTKFLMNSKGDLTEAFNPIPATVMKKGEKGAKGKYSIEYLDKIITTKLDTLKIFMGTDYPIKLSYANNKGTVSIVHILAPRIDS